MEYRPFEPGIEVNGRTVWSIVDGFRAFSLLASQFLLEEGVGQKGPDGIVKVEPDGWYSQEGYLRAFKRIAKSVGESVLFDIGSSIPRNAEFPPQVVDVHSAVGAIDVAYHMNHRREGSAMFDPSNGTMLEGIGHYGYATPAARRIVSVCENPYPCAFDRGIVTAMATRFEPTSKVVHDDSKPCRRKGAESCTYIVTW